jgi:histidinol-phosphate aminotransferase
MIISSITALSSFVMYGMIAKFTRLNYQGVDLNDDFEIDLNAMLHSIETSSKSLDVIFSVFQVFNILFVRMMISHDTIPVQFPPVWSSL